MLKPYTIGMLEHTAKNNPAVVAHTTIENGAVFTIADGKTVLPTATTAKGKDLWVAINTMNGDDYGTDATIAAGAYVNAYQLAAWEGQYVELTGVSAAVGDNLVVNTKGGFEKATSTDGYALVLKVEKVTVLNGDQALLAQIVVPNATAK